MTNELRDQQLVEGGFGNLFFLVPAFTPLSDRWCANLLASESAPGNTVIFVAATQSPDDRLQAWQSHVGTELPARIGFVNLQGMSRASNGEPIMTAERDGCEIRIETVQHPGNLTKIGISLTTFLTEWSDGDDRVVICFDSLTTLLQFVDVKTLYRFLHELTSQVRVLGAMAHYHLDPTAHGEQTVNQFMSLFDGVVEPDGTGDWRLRTRSLS